MYMVKLISKKIFSERIQIKMKNSAYTPFLPVISRFSPPWDADGWYYVGRNFSKRSKIYSNAEVYPVKFNAQKYKGADFIVTFDSVREGKDDHQECDFYVERNCTVAVAFDKSAAETDSMPEWIADFTDTETEIITNEKKHYGVFERSFEAGEHIVVPGFEGEYANYFILAVPAEEPEPIKNRLPSAPYAAPYPAYPKRGYVCYLSEAFKDGVPADFETTGEVLSANIYSDKKYNSVKLSAGSSMNKSFATSSRIVASTTLTTASENARFRFGAVKMEGGMFRCGGKELCPAKIGVPTSITIKYDYRDMTADVEINHLTAGKCIPVEGCEPAYFSCDEGELFVDYVTVTDETELFAANEEFKTMPRLALTESALAEIAPFPFEKNRSLKLSSSEGFACGYDFPVMTGIASIEARVFVSDDRCTAFRVMGAAGEEIGAAAFFKNCLYATVAGEWCCVADKITPYCYYPTGNWYEVKFTVNTEKGLYDVWVDGARRAEKLKFTDKARSFSRIEFSHDGEGELYINRIRAYDAADLCRGITRGEIFDVRRYGARGNGKTDDTEAFSRAVADAAYTGGTVYVPEGVYLTGEIKLASDMTLFISPEATIIGTQDHSAYPLREPGKSLCAHRQLGRALIYGEGLRNVTVTGGGMLDGNGKYRFKMNDPVSDRRELDARPNIIYITYSSEINIENLNMRRSAFWTVVPLSSRNITIKNLRLNCMNTPNRDGIDPVDCQNISIYNCNVMAGDDGLCFKSSDTVGCRNIDVRDMMICSLASAVKFGTDTYYCLKNARFADCFIKNVNRCGVSLETVDGAEISDVLFLRFDITDASAPAYVVTGKRNRLPKNVTEIRMSKINGVTFADFNFRSPRTHGHPLPIYETMIVGQSDDQSIDNLTIENWNIEVMGGARESSRPAPTPIDDKYPEYDRHGLSAGYAFTLRFVKGIEMKNINVTDMKFSDARPLAAFFDCKK